MALQQQHTVLLLQEEETAAEGDPEAGLEEVVGLGLVLEQAQQEWDLLLLLLLLLQLLQQQLLLLLLLPQQQQECNRQLVQHLLSPLFLLSLTSKETASSKRCRRQTFS